MKKLLVFRRSILYGTLIFSLVAFFAFKLFLIKQRKNLERSIAKTLATEININLNGHDFRVRTKTNWVIDFLKEQNFKVAGEDYIFPKKATPVSPGMKITIKNQIPVFIKVDGEKIVHKTFGSSVEDVLREKEIELNPIDELNYNKETSLFREIEIEVIRINVKEVTEEEKIAFKTVTKDDPTLKWRKIAIKQSGELGIKEIRYRLTYADGELTSKEKLCSKITKDPVSKIIANGTKMEIGKTYKGRASWYAFNGEMSCASLRHPVGTWLRVTNKSNGKSIIVRVSDRGPFSEDKIIDLDKTAFAKLANLGQGVVEVKVEEIID